MLPVNNIPAVCVFLCDIPAETSLSLRPAVNVEDVDHQKAAGGGGEEKSTTPQTFPPQDPKLTTLTVPVAPAGGRQR